MLVEQLELFEPTTEDLKRQILSLSTSLTKIQRAAFRDISQLRQEMTDLYTHLEIMSDALLKIEKYN